MGVRACTHMWAYPPVARAFKPEGNGMGVTTGDMDVEWMSTGKSWLGGD